MATRVSKADSICRSTQDITHNMPVWLCTTARRQFRESPRLQQTYLYWADIFSRRWHLPSLEAAVFSPWHACVCYRTSGLHESIRLPAHKTINRNNLLASITSGVSFLFPELIWPSGCCSANIHRCNLYHGLEGCIGTTSAVTERRRAMALDQVMCLPGGCFVWNLWYRHWVQHVLFSHPLRTGYHNGHLLHWPAGYCTVDV